MTRYSGNIVRAQLPGASAAGASGAWELEDAAQQIGSGAWPAAVGLNDPNFFRNALLLNGDGTNGAQNNTFLDSSTNNLTITRNGNATQGSFTPFGGANYSAYFDGSSYLAATSSSAFDFSTGNFTIEFWFNAASVTAQSTIVEKRSGAAFDWIFFITAGAAIQWYPGFDQSTTITSSTAVAANTWNHVAGVRNGSTFTLYLNGVSVGTTTSASAISYAAGAPVNIGYDNSTTARFYFSGYVSNVRIVKGSAVYTTAFTPSAAPLNTTSSTTLLTCASQSFEDLSPTTATITRVGTPRVTEFSPFNSYNRTPASYGVTFNGSSDYLSVGSTPTLSSTTTPFTIECWVYPTVQLSGTALFSTNFTGGGQSIPFCIFGATNITTNTSGSNLCAGYYNGSAWVGISSTTSLTLNQWSHVALVFNGTVATLYLNGVSIGSATTSWTTSTATPFLIGRRWDTTATPYFGGNISNFRFVVGSAIYTANFTPPTAPLTAVSGTQLLTCQDTTFKDNSTNAAAITVNGSARPTKANPFGYTITSGFGYSPATMGGSAYFDGTGDYLDLPNNVVFSQAGAWTVEMWVYPTTNPTSQYWFSQNTANFLQISTNASGFVAIDKSGVGVQITATTATQVNAWNHVAMVSNGTTLYLFVNGILQGSASVGTTATSAATTRIGAYQGTGGLALTGYISNVRMLKGTALYTSSFVPPASPLTAVTNTQLLLSMANGSIFDYANGTTFETVSGAKIDTTTKKYGTGSIAFNGTSDYLRAPFNPALNFGTGNFTIECWVYVASSANSDQTIIASNQSWAAGAVLVKAYQTGNVSFSAYDYNSGGTAMVSSAATLNTWVHVALVRNGNTFTLYLNGTSAATQTSTIAVNFAPTNGTYIGHAGAINPTTGYLNGYIDDLRISRYARYTANFTPPGQLQIY